MRALLSHWLNLAVRTAAHLGSEPIEKPMLTTPTTSSPSGRKVSSLLKGRRWTLWSFSSWFCWPLSVTCGGLSTTGSWLPVTSSWILRLLALGETFQFPPLLCSPCSGPQIQESLRRRTRKILGRRKLSQVNGRGQGQVTCMGQRSPDCHQAMSRLVHVSGPELWTCWVLFL